MTTAARLPVGAALPLPSDLRCIGCGFTVHPGYGPCLGFVLLINKPLPLLPLPKLP